VLALDLEASLLIHLVQNLCLKIRPLAKTPDKQRATVAAVVCCHQLDLDEMYLVLFLNLPVHLESARLVNRKLPDLIPVVR
jgi:hypothetical protein